jgi:hypothetical protein
LIQAWQFNLSGKSGHAARKNHRHVEHKSGTICCVKTWQTALAIFVALSASFTLADDFKTLDGKEYKDATPK